MSSKPMNDSTKCEDEALVWRTVPIMIGEFGNFCHQAGTSQTPVPEKSEERGSILSRQDVVSEEEKYMAVDKDKNVLKSCIGGTSFNEDLKGLTVVEGWDKNIKRKRSVGGTNARILDADREGKLAMQQRQVFDPHLRSSDGFTFRTSNGEESFSGKQSHLTKGRTSRMPRTPLNSPPTSSSAMPRTPEGLEGPEHIRCLNETQLLGAPNNRKRPLPLGQSSPATTLWGGQRQQKSLRTRRTNVTSPVSSHDGSLFLTEDIGSRLTSNDPSRVTLCKAILNNSQLKVKVENFLSPIVLLESDEAGVDEVESKDKLPQNYEGAAAGAANVSQKAVEPEAPPIKKARGREEELVDAVEEHVKTMRGSAQSKSCLALKGKFDVPEMTKLMRSGRPVLDRSESKTGCSSSKKIADCQNGFRPEISLNVSASKHAGDYGDDHDELIAASAYAHYFASVHNFQISSDRTSELFWEKMRPFFAYVNSDQISHLMEMIKLATDMDGCFELDSHIKDGVYSQGLSQSLSTEELKNQPDSVEHSKHPGIVHSIDELQNVTGRQKLRENRCLKMAIPLSQRLLSAIIPEHETGRLSYNTGESLYSKVAQDYTNALNGLVGLESEDVKNRLAPENGNCFPSRSQSRDNFSYRGSAICHDLWNTSVVSELHRSGLHQNPTTPDSRINSHPIYAQNGVGDAQTVDEIFPVPFPSDRLYEHMSLDDKILLELQSIGICLDIASDLDDGEEDEIDKDIYELMTRLYGQMGKKKERLCNLDSAIQNQRVLEERSLEQLALNKLVEMAYGKLMVGRRSHGSACKGGHSKVSRRAALAFAKRVLARCHKFENTGKSCFSDPPYRDILFSPRFSSESKCGSVIDCQLTSRIQSLSPCTNFVDKHGSIRFQHGDSYLNPSRCFAGTQDPSFPGNETIFNKDRKKAVLLDEVGSPSSRALSAPANTLPECLKGKRSEKDRNQSKGVSTRSFTKSARQSSGPSKGERRTATRSKQRTTHPLARENDISNRHGSQALLPALSDGGKSVLGGHLAGLAHPNNCTPRLSKEMASPDSLTLSRHILDELGSEAHDISTWLNVDEESLQDTELMGLEIPMDDLSELDINF